MSEQKPQWTLTMDAGKVVWRIPLPVYEGKALVLDLTPAEADSLGKRLQAYATEVSSPEEGQAPCGAPLTQAWESQADQGQAGEEAMKWIVVSPPFFQGSNGLRFLHRMVDRLNALGRDATIAIVHDDRAWSQEVGLARPGTTNPEWNTPLWRGPIDVPGSIVVYPEIVYTNPLGAERVVRYFGNRDGCLTGKKVEVGPGDYILAHSKGVHPSPNRVLYYSEVNPVFHAEGAPPLSERFMECTYEGKGLNYGPVHTIPGSMLIQRDWPPTQDALADILRRTRILHTWDAWTNTNVEAVLCGAMPIFHRYGPWSAEDLDACEIGPIPRLIPRQPLPSDEDFDEQRRALLGRIQSLQASWPERFKAFVEDAERYFGG